MTHAKSEKDLLVAILERLDVVVGFLAAKDLADKELVVQRLKDLEFSARTMALVTGLTENAINIRLSRMKKRALKRNSRR
jgi:hypothetical protein